MVITRTPFRVSLFGGGTDYPEWFRKHEGKVLSGSINKYCYVTARWLPPFFPYKHRVVWSQNEMVDQIDEIENPCVREVLEYLEISDGVEIHHDADLPARSGMGSSSTFTVGLLHALSALTGRHLSKQDLAHGAIEIEQKRIGDTVGCQDQTAAAFGGFNTICFGKTGDITVSPWVGKATDLIRLQQCLRLFFTGTHRIASEVASTFVTTLAEKEEVQHRMYAMVDEAATLLRQQHLSTLGRLLDEAWSLKRGLSAAVSSEELDGLYACAKKAGAWGGKLLGAGGGGFLLTVSPKTRTYDVMSALADLIHVPFEFEHEGSRIIYYDRQACTRPAVWGFS